LEPDEDVVGLLEKVTRHLRGCSTMWDWSQNEDDVGLLEEATPVVARYGQQQ
jgi:hypothetical protein